MTLAEVVREKRKEKGWTQRELSRRTSIPQSFLSRLEAGKATPVGDHLARLVMVLGDLSTDGVSYHADREFLQVALPVQVVAALTSLGKSGLYEGRSAEDVASALLRHAVRELLQGQARYWGHG